MGGPETHFPRRPTPGPHPGRLAGKVAIAFTVASGGSDLLRTGCRSRSVPTAGAPSQSSSPSPCPDESSDVEVGGVVAGGAVVVVGGGTVVVGVVVVVVPVDESSWPP